jgi:hypothetical protein
MPLKGLHARTPSHRLQQPLLMSSTSPYVAMQVSNEGQAKKLITFVSIASRCAVKKTRPWQYDIFDLYNIYKPCQMTHLYRYTSVCAVNTSNFGIRGILLGAGGDLTLTSQKSHDAQLRDFTCPSCLVLLLAFSAKPDPSTVQQDGGIKIMSTSSNDATMSVFLVFGLARTRSRAQDEASRQGSGAHIKQQQHVSVACSPM